MLPPRNPRGVGRFADTPIQVNYALRDAAAAYARRLEPAEPVVVPHSWDAVYSRLQADDRLILGFLP